MINRLFTKDFWNRAGARALRTAIQGFIAATASCSAIQDVNWLMIGSTTALAVLISLAMSMLRALPEENEVA